MCAQGYCYVNYSTPAAAAAAQQDLNGIEYPPGSGFRLKVMYAEIMTGANSSTTTNAHSSMSNGSSTAALLRSSSSRSSLSAGGPTSSGTLGAMLRANSGSFNAQGAMYHSGSSNALAAAASGGSFPGVHLHGAQVVSAGPAPLSAVTPFKAAGSTAGSSALLSPVGSSDPHSSSSTVPVMPGLGSAGVLGSTGPSPSASPLCDPQVQYHQQQHQQQQSDVARVTDRLSSLSLPNMSAPSPQNPLGSIGSEHSNDLAVAAAAAAAAQHYSDLKAATGGALPNTGGLKVPVEGGRLKKAVSCGAWATAGAGFEQWVDKACGCCSLAQRPVATQKHQ